MTRSNTPEETAVRMGAIALGIDPHEYRQQIDAGLKWCSDCKRWQPRSEFGPHRGRRDGLNTACAVSIRGRARVTMARLRAERRQHGLQ